MSRCRPQSRVDGMRNIWILKPGDKSLGRGIVLKNSLNDILHKVNQAAKEGMQYVVQKYIGKFTSFFLPSKKSDISIKKVFI